MVRETAPPVSAEPALSVFESNVIVVRALMPPHTRISILNVNKRKSLVIMFIVKGLSYITAKLVVIDDTNK